MTSILKVSEIQDPTNSNTAISIDATGKVTAPNLVMPAGSVIQVVSNFTKADINTTSTSFVSTGLSASITPTSTSSKVLVIVSVGSWYVSANSAFGTVFRDTTNIGDSSAGLMQVYQNASYAPSTCQVLDAPASTSSLTYAVHFRAVGGTSYVSYSTYGHFTITLMEIAG